VEFPVILRAGEDGWVLAECPVIPGCVTQGRSKAEALENIREAIALALETRSGEGWDAPSALEVVMVYVPVTSRT